MNKFSLFLLALCGLLSISCNDKCTIVWTEGETDPATGQAQHRFEILNPPAGTDWSIAYCQFRAPIQMAENAPARIDHIAGTLYRIVPVEECKGKMVIDYSSRPFVNHGRAPEGMYLVRDGQEPVELAVKHVFLPCEKHPGLEVAECESGVFDMIPALKSVNELEGTVPADTEVKTELVEGKVSGWYKITIDEPVTVQAADEDGAYWAGITLDNIRANAGADIPKAVIEDWPDMGYRGLMLDVSRDFTAKEGVLKLIDLMAHYKANVLHLHIGDDEGWRVEIDSLPELTAYGAFRGIPTFNEDGSFSEPEALQNSYSGSLGREDKTSPANGYYSHADFVEILRYATDHHIRVIPEFDSPGHSRAAVKSLPEMLQEPEDVSEYLSVQDYTDNVLNVALEGTYEFVAKVFDGFKALYAEAGAPLATIHIGGDEVPEGAWMGSPACKRLMEENGWTNASQLMEYFISRVLDIAEEKGLKIAGWQDIAQTVSEENFAKFVKNTEYVNMWSTSESKHKDEMTYDFANRGIGVVLSNSGNAYLDFAYNPSKLERGHNWGGYIDERRTFSLLPFDIYKSIRWDDDGDICDISGKSDGKIALTEEGKANILGVQGQLWAETIRNFDHVTYYIFPKALGLFERGWNASPVWEGTTVSDDPLFEHDFTRFFNIIRNHEYPYYDALGISYHKNGE